jgi:membrane fusion protein (multidrug efflux system)
VRKGQILSHRSTAFQAVLDQANAQVAQAQAQLAKTAMDVDRDTPLAKERAIAQSQLTTTFRPTGRRRRRSRPPRPKWSRPS